MKEQESVGNLLSILKDILQQDYLSSMLVVNISPPLFSSLLISFLFLTSPLVFLSSLPHSHFFVGSVVASQVYGKFIIFSLFLSPPFLLSLYSRCFQTYQQ